MKLKIQTPKIAPVASHKTDRKRPEKALPITGENVENQETQLGAETLAKFYRKPAEGTMLLNNQGGIRQINPSWEVVEKVVRELNPGHGNSHACLSVPGKSYIQCLHGFNGYHLEWRITNPSGSYVHYRACYPGGSKKEFELKKHDFVSDGQYRDLLNLDDVVDSFRSFHQRQGLPGFLKWRELDL